MQSNNLIVRSALSAVLCCSGLPLAVGGTEDATPLAAPSEYGETVAVLAGPPAAASKLGIPLVSGQLSDYRGGFDVVKNDMQLSGSVANNSAVNVMSGSNYIADGAFSNASGLPMVIQNSGSNVLIQNATIVNVQFK